MNTSGRCNSDRGLCSPKEKTMKSTKTVLAVAIVIAGVFSFGCGSSQAGVQDICQNSFTSEQSFNDVIAILETVRDLVLSQPSKDG